MNHAEYRKLFPQYPQLPDDKIVYGPHPNHGNWYKPQWNASQMLSDQNNAREFLSRWTNANMIGDLGAYGRYQEAKQLAGADRRRMMRRQKPLHPSIDKDTLGVLRADAVRKTYVPLFENTTERAFVTSVLLGGFIGGAISVARGGSIYEAAGIVDVTAVSMIGAKAVQAGLRARRMRKLSEDAAIGSDAIISKSR